MKTQNDKAIKSLLNQLFKRNRADKWNAYDTTITISYLIQSQFKHIDLLNILSSRHPKLYGYYFHNCKCSFINTLNVRRVNKLCDVIAFDSKAHYLYFMHLCEMKRENYMAAFAYYKNYFDRVTADLDFVFKVHPELKRPNYNGFYKENSFKSFYSEIANSQDVISKAHSLRNSNPLSHSSSELLDNDNTSNELRNSMKELSKLVYEYIDQQKN